MLFKPDACKDNYRHLVNCYKKHKKETKIQFVKTQRLKSK